MQEITEIDKDDYVLNPRYNCQYDCPRLCDCEVCDGGEDEDEDDDWDE